MRKILFTVMILVLSVPSFAAVVSLLAHDDGEVTLSLAASTYVGIYLTTVQSIGF